MSRIEQAKEIYELTKDMDYGDYIETYDSDIEYVAGLIAHFGYNIALKMCDELADYGYC